MRAKVPLSAFLCVAGFATPNAPPAPTPFPAFLYTVAKSYDPLAWTGGEDRFSGEATLFIQTASGRQALVPNFAASADAALSFDSKTVVFAGKPTPHDNWQIWEISTFGGEPKRVTNCPDDCIRPLYLPDDHIVYGERTGGRFVIRAVARDAGKTISLTYGPGSSLPSDVLQDGRLLFDSTFPLGEKGAPELYTVYSDGSGVESYRCDHGKPRHSGKQVESGDVVFAADHGLARFTSALAHDVHISAPPGDYAGDIAETPSGEWLVSWRPNARSSFHLMWWKPGQLSLRPALEKQAVNVVQPVLLENHLAPRRHPSGLHEWTYGNLLCLKAYISKNSFPPNSIRSVRLYTRDEYGSPQLLGTSEVEPDGSFFVQLSGDQPLQIELIDGIGKTLKRERGWFWLRRGEQRACVGCHAGPETAPENGVPLVLLKSTIPTDMTHAAQTSTGGH